MISVYLTSQQLGIRWRVLGLICGWIPIAHLVMLHIIIRTVRREVKFEKLRAKRNAARADKQICKTKYPILMVHGVFFRDFEHLNYWGRIPAELTENGAKIYYGNHNSAAAVRDSAKELEARIRQIVEETGCEKVNVIAHSKGGLDTRAAIALTSAGDYIASLTTINTPHRGCEFADYLLDNIPEAQQKAIEKAYNVEAEKLGDTNPDFMAAVHVINFSKTTSIQIDVRNRINPVKSQDHFLTIFKLRFFIIKYRSVFIILLHQCFRLIFIIPKERIRHLSGLKKCRINIPRNLCRNPVQLSDIAQLPVFMKL